MAQNSPDRKPGHRPMRRGKGFTRAGGLVQPQIRKAGEDRGFAMTRLLTHWAEIVGEDVARLCRPVKVGYGRAGLGATLTLLARSAAGPMLQAQIPAIRERVNACYGYAAIARIQITQTAPQGFAETQEGYATRPATPEPPAPETLRAIETLTGAVRDPELRAALAALGAQVISRTDH